jgi:adenylate kinase
MKTIVITGTPSTGKTTLASKLCKKYNFAHLDVNKVIKNYGLSEGYDRKRKTKIIDAKKLNKALVKEISKAKLSNNKKTLKDRKRAIVVDSHLSHHLTKKYVDLCIVAKCSLKTLKKRLERRYSKAKIRENLDAEIFDVCLNEAKEFGHKTVVVDTTKGIKIESVFKKIRRFWRQ